MIWAKPHWFEKRTSLRPLHRLAAYVVVFVAIEVVVTARVGDGRLFDDEAVAALMTRVVDASWFSVDDNTDFGVPARLPSPLRRRPPVARPTSSPMRTVTVADAASVMPLFRRRRRHRPTAVAPSPSGTLRRRGRCDDISSEGDGEGSLARRRLRGHGRAGERGRWRGRVGGNDDMERLRLEMGGEENKALCS